MDEACVRVLGCSSIRSTLVHACSEWCGRRSARRRRRKSKPTRRLHSLTLSAQIKSGYRAQGPAQSSLPPQPRQNLPTPLLLLPSLSQISSVNSPYTTSRATASIPPHPVELFTSRLPGTALATPCPPPPLPEPLPRHGLPVPLRTARQSRRRQVLPHTNLVGRGVDPELTQGFRSSSLRFALPSSIFSHGPVLTLAYTVKEGKESLNAQTMAVNFKRCVCALLSFSPFVSSFFRMETLIEVTCSVPHRFVQKSGPIFVAQDAVEAVLLWEDTFKTAFFAALYGFLCTSSS